jgi:hypothetical protein
MSATTQERFFRGHDTAPHAGLILGCTLLRCLFWKPSCFGSSYFPAWGGQHVPSGTRL